VVADDVMRRETVDWRREGRRVAGQSAGAALARRLRHSLWLRRWATSHGLSYTPRMRARVFVELVTQLAARVVGLAEALPWALHRSNEGPSLDRSALEETAANVWKVGICR